MQGVFVAVTVYLTLRTVLFRCRLESSFATDGLTSGPGASHRISIRGSLRRGKDGSRADVNEPSGAMPAVVVTRSRQRALWPLPWLDALLSPICGPGILGDLSGAAPLSH